jgi:hypothetical protein
VVHDLVDILQALGAFAGATPARVVAEGGVSFFPWPSSTPTSLDVVEEEAKLIHGRGREPTVEVNRRAAVHVVLVVDEGPDDGVHGLADGEAR